MVDAIISMEIIPKVFQEVRRLYRNTEGKDLTALIQQMDDLGTQTMQRIKNYSGNSKLRELQDAYFA